MKKPNNTTPHKACEYDEKVRKVIPYYEVFHSETIDLIKTLKPDVKTWLDTGCGTGYLAREAIKHFPDTLFILADPSDGMLQEAKKCLGDIFPEQIQFVDSAVSEDLPEKLSVQPEVITAIMCHHYLKPEKRQATVQRCFDLLAPEGVYITFENIRPSSQKGIEACLDRWKRFQMSQGRSQATVENHLKRFDTEYFPITIVEHLGLLKETGFGNVNLFWHSCVQAGFYAIK